MSLLLTALVNKVNDCTSWQIPHLLHLPRQPRKLFQICNSTSLFFKKRSVAQDNFLFYLFSCSILKKLQMGKSSTSLLSIGAK